MVVLPPPPPPPHPLGKSGAVLRPETESRAIEVKRVRRSGGLQGGGKLGFIQFQVLLYFLLSF